MKPPTDTPAPALLQATDLHKIYHMGSEDLEVLRGVALDVKRGEWLAVLGASGSGKSTLLHLLGGLDRPDKGAVVYEGRNVFEQSPRELDMYRAQRVGFVFQFYHLLPEFNVLENVMMASMVHQTVFAWPRAKAEVRSRAEKLLARLGLSHRLRHRPARLSGGERQRTAIARALVNAPDILLADEPTGNLDAKTGDAILEVFHEFHRGGQTIVMVTHDSRIAHAANRRLTLEAGRLKG